jgi:hypothetical protein
MKESRESLIARDFHKKTIQFDHLYSDYNLSVSVVKSCALLLLQAASDTNSEELNKAAEHLFNYLCNNHPEIRPAIKELLEKLGVLDK